MTEAGPSHTERVMWLRLARTRGLGATGFARAIARYGDAETALKDLPARARAAGHRRLDIPGPDCIEAELDQIERAEALDLATVTGVRAAIEAWSSGQVDGDVLAAAVGTLGDAADASGSAADVHRLTELGAMLARIQ